MLTWWLTGQDKHRDSLSSITGNNRYITSPNNNKESQNSVSQRRAIADLVKDTPKVSTGNGSMHFKRLSSSNSPIDEKNITLPGSVVLEELS